MCESTHATHSVRAQRYVDGAAITQEDMDAAVGTTFSCESGFELDTTVTFVCATPNGARVALVLFHGFFMHT